MKRPTNSTPTQLDIEAPYTVLNVELQMSYTTLQELRVAIAAVTKLPVFTRTEKAAAEELLRHLDEALNKTPF